MTLINNDNKLIWCFNGQKVLIEAWGKNSFRVRAIALGGFSAEKLTVSFDSNSKKMVGME